MKEQLQRRAHELGFDLCRVTTAAPPASGARFAAALAEGRHAEMQWLARNADKRRDPALVLPSVRSVVVLAVSYKPSASARPGDPGSESKGEVARYARYADYHEVLAGPLRELATLLDELGGPGTRSLWYVDTGPVLERDLAQRAGVGFVGKHTNLISRRLGNWFFLAEILTTAELAPDEPEINRCGSCSRCLTACPTGALPSPFTLDARRCISYLTIELKGSIPTELRPLLGNRIYGCDDCLAVCPWNRFAREASLLSAHARPDLDQPDLLALLELDAAAFRTRFAGTPILRTRRRGLLRNVCVALGNVGGPEALPALARARHDPEPLIAEHAAWAIGEIERRATGAGTARPGSRPP
jgi:epoxyqueuosine reductase